MFCNATFYTFLFIRVNFVLAFTLYNVASETFHLQNICHIAMKLRYCYKFQKSEEI